MIKSARQVLLYIVVATGLILFMASLASLPYETNLWWLTLFDFPRLQILIASGVVLSVFLLIKKNWNAWHSAFAIAMTSTIAIQIFYIYPYTVLRKETVPDIERASADSASTFSIVLVNVLQTNRQAEELIRIVNKKDPDIVLAMETNKWWQDALEPLNKQYPYGIEYPLDNYYGMILYSKFELEDPEIRFLIYDSVPSFHTRMILPGKKRIYFHGVHPPPPVPGGPETESEKEIALQKVGAMVKANKLPAVVAGDLNDVAWADVPRLFDAGGILNDVREGRKIMPTYNAMSLIFRWPLDYIYVTNHFGVIEFTRLEKFGSDHFPVYVELAIMTPQTNVVGK